VWSDAEILLERYHAHRVRGEPVGESGVLRIIKE
jgi:hypothetical protein